MVLFLSLFTALLIVIAITTTSNVLHKLGQEEVVVQFALPYYKVMTWSMIPMMIFLSAKQFSDGLEITKTAMLLSLVSLPLNAFLNWIFIYGHFGMPRLELLGTGIATLITRCAIAITLLTIIFRHKVYKPIFINTCKSLEI